MGRTSFDNGTKSLANLHYCFKNESLKKSILGSTRVSDMKDRYTLGEQLGVGQFGVIRACSDKLSGEVLACKSISKDRLVTDNDVRSIKLEIEIMTKLSGHPNVVDLKAVYEEEDYVHLIMELCAGGELFHRLEKQGRFSEYNARFMFRHLMQVVKYCHENGIVHRDLKPENILLATSSSSSPIKLADFGLATYIKPGHNLNGTVGSPFYIAPEVLSGGYNQAADVWSAGVILFILLSGMPPFWGQTKSEIFNAVRAAKLEFPAHIWDYVSASAKDLITKMLSVDPSSRLTSAQVLAHSWMEGGSTKAAQILNVEDDNCSHLEIGGVSFSTSIVGRNQDYSFSDGQLEQSPAFTCRSSFSSFRAHDDSPCSIQGGFSLMGCRKSDIVEFSSPIPSLPSFTFTSPISTSDQGSNSFGFIAKKSITGEIYGDSNLEKLTPLPDLVPIIKEVGESGNGIQASRGGTCSSKDSNIQHKRNHTIELGELNQLDIVVAAETIVRWASCTLLPTAPSLRSSLVC